MATTETRTGFRLPWSSADRGDTAADPGTPGTDEPTDPAGASESQPEGTETQPMAIEPVTAAEADGAAPGGASEDVAAHEPSPEPTTATSSYEEGSPVESAVTVAAPTRPTAVSPPVSPKKPSQFMADLSRAMQAAASSARAASLTQFQVDAKTHVEGIHSRSTTEATDLRTGADEDIASYRDWQKAQIARIREETETRIGDRKAGLERELEAHAARIEREIERVQSCVAEYETEMDRFFQSLLAEDDPTRIAELAERLPEPPSFEALVGGPATEPAWSQPTAATVVVDEAPAVEAPAVEAPAVEAPAVEAPAVEAVAPTIDEVSDDAGPGEAVSPASENESIEAAMAAIEAAYHAADAEELATPDPEDAAGTSVEAVAESTSDPVEATAEPTTSETAEPAPSETEDEPVADLRLAALGLTHDLSHAEAEAVAEAVWHDDDGITTIADDALAARLAGLVPHVEDAEADGPTERSQVVVTGLVSVASIAGFKRQLGRLNGVRSVGVSSGPDGEFVFNVEHGSGVDLGSAVPTLSGFQARVTGSGDGILSVSARDPESES